VSDLKQMIDIDYGMKQLGIIIATNWIPSWINALLLTV